MKKGIALLISIMLIAAIFTGCSDEKKSDSQSENSSTSVETTNDGAEVNVDGDEH